MLSGILGPILVLGLLMGLYAFMFGGLAGRTSARGRALTGLADPSQSRLGVAALGGFALGNLAVRIDGAADSVVGFTLGFVLGITLAIPVARQFAIAACFVLGTVLALWTMIEFIAGDEAGDLAVIYRIALMALLFACYVLSALLFGRTSAVRGESGLALFGLVELVTFLAQSGGVTPLGLDRLGHLVFLGIVCGVAFLVGWAATQDGASGFVLGVMALALGTLAFLTDAVVGNAQIAWVGLVAALTAAAFTFLSGAVTRRVGLR